MILLLFLSIALLKQSPFTVSTNTYDIHDFGAEPDGRTDSSEALLQAWSAACRSYEISTILVPAGNFLVKGMVKFEGPCINSITVQINGTLKAPSGYDGGDSYMLLFYKVKGLKIHGDGEAVHLDGGGGALWDCKKGGGKCPDGATTLGIMNCGKVSIAKLKCKDSQLFHIAVNGCEHVRILRVQIRAPADGPNTDGIHVQMSNDVTIANADIETGDDCISIGPGSSNMWIRNINASKCHGLSLGSLARDSDERGVENVTFSRVKLYNTTNGFRLKAWGRPSNTYAKNIMFDGAQMFNVANPILIDKNYCPNSENCPGQRSGIDISNITYRNIRGSSSTKVAVKFDCTGLTPCNEIKLESIHLKYENEPAQTTCCNAVATTIDSVEPSINCLSY